MTTDLKSAVSMNPDGSGTIEVCKTCRGPGSVISGLCPVCKGSGYPTWSKEHHEHSIIIGNKSSDVQSH